MSEKPGTSRPRRLRDWLNPTGARKVPSLADKVYKLHSMEYDPATHWLVAAGTEGNPGRQLDQHGLEEGLFEEMQFNTETGQVKLKKFLAIIRR